MSWLKKIAIAGALGASLGIAGCTVPPWMPFTQDEFDRQVIAVQEFCKQTCSFLPTAKTISQLMK